MYIQKTLKGRKSVDRSYNGFMIDGKLVFSYVFLRKS